MPAVFDTKYVARISGPNVKRGKTKRDLAEQLRQTTAARDDLSQRAMLAAQERYVGADRENVRLRALLRTLYEGLSKGYCLWCDDTPLNNEFYEHASDCPMTEARALLHRDT